MSRVKDLSYNFITDIEGKYTCLNAETIWILLFLAPCSLETRILYVLQKRNQKAMLKCLFQRGYFVTLVTKAI
jgi:hypothetical protein